MENVIGFTAIDGGKLKDALLRKFRELGYANADIYTIDAANHGVPQRSQASFLIGFLNRTSMKFQNKYLEHVISHLIQLLTQYLGICPL